MAIPIFEWANIEKEMRPFVEQVYNGEITKEDFEEIYNMRMEELSKKYATE